MDQSMWEALQKCIGQCSEAARAAFDRGLEQQRTGLYAQAIDSIREAASLGHPGARLCLGYPDPEAIRLLLSEC